MEIIDIVIRVLLLVSFGLNLWGCVLSGRVIKRARKSWEAAEAVIEEATKLRDEMKRKLEIIFPKEGEEQ